MRKPIIKEIVGGVLIIIGLLGLALPILPGILLIILGLGLFGIRIAFIDKIWAYVKSLFRKQV